MKEIIEHVYFEGKRENLVRFVEEYTQSGDLDGVRNEDGCIRFEFYASIKKENILLLSEHWSSDDALAKHYATSFMANLLALIKKYDLTFSAEKYEV